MTPNRIPAEDSPQAMDVPVCPECGHSELETVWAHCPFHYGVGANAVEIDVNLPVRKCRQCGFEFFDDEAEDLRHEAVCRHLDVLTPAEICALRAMLGIDSRAEFARLTRIGEATIARWERGELIQNAGYDSLLRLLQHPENVERLRHRKPCNRAGTPPVNRVSKFKYAQPTTYIGVRMDVYGTIGSRN